MPDSGGAGSSSSSSSSGGTSSSSSSSGGTSSSSSSSSSGATPDAGSNIVTIFPFDTATSGTDVANWPGDTYCIGQTTVPGTGDAGGGSDGGDAGDAGDAATAAAVCNSTPATEVFLQGVSTVTYDSTVGDTGLGGDEGSLKIVIPFYGYNQQADFQHIFPLPVSYLAGQTLFVRVRLEGGNPTPTSFPNGFVLAVKSGQGYTYASTIYANISPNPNGWQEFDLPISTPPFIDTTNPSGYDPTNIVAIELHFDTGSGPTPPATAAPPATATFHVDTIGYFPTPM